MLPIRLYVLGEPKAQPRAKARRCGGFVQMYTPATAKEWKGLIADAVKPFLSKAPIDCALLVELVFYMPRPKAHFKKSGLRDTAPYWHTNKPDSDNLTKAVFDAITDTGLWRDDSLVAHTTCRKVYADNDGKTGCAITISPL